MLSRFGSNPASCGNYNVLTLFGNACYAPLLSFRRASHVVEEPEVARQGQHGLPMATAAAEPTENRIGTADMEAKVRQVTGCTERGSGTQAPGAELRADERVARGSSDAPSTTHVLPPVGPQTVEEG